MSLGPELGAEQVALAGMRAAPSERRDHVMPCGDTPLPCSRGSDHPHFWGARRGAQILHPVCPPSQVCEVTILVPFWVMFPEVAWSMWTLTEGFIHSFGKELCTDLVCTRRCPSCGPNVG